LQKALIELPGHYGQKVRDMLWFCDSSIFCGLPAGTINNVKFARNAPDATSALINRNAFLQNYISNLHDDMTLTTKMSSFVEEMPQGIASKELGEMLAPRAITPEQTETLEQAFRIINKTASTEVLKYAGHASRHGLGEDQIEKCRHWASIEIDV